MSLYDYRMSINISAGTPHRGDPPFAAIIMAAIRKADSYNLQSLQVAWPDIYEEFWERHRAPDGVLATDADGGDIKSVVVLAPEEPKAGETWIVKVMTMLPERADETFRAVVTGRERNMWQVRPEGKDEPLPVWLGRDFFVRRVEG